MTGAAQLSPEDTLLLLAAGADGPYALDPVRLMKGAFLVVARGKREWKPFFQFEAYDYGPFDRRVYDVRDALLRRGLLEATAGRYETYHLTSDGEARVRDLARELGEDATWIRRIGRYVSTRSFSQLLQEIYANYPQYRERSRFRQ